MTETSEPGDHVYVKANIYADNPTDGLIVEIAGDRFRVDRDEILPAVIQTSQPKEVANWAGIEDVQAALNYIENESARDPEQLGAAYLRGLLPGIKSRGTHPMLSRLVKDDMETVLLEEECCANIHAFLAGKGWFD